ncbi:hypothetical protein Tco_0005292 [Tanacetum coccineum]
MENTNPSSPPESSNSLRDRIICELGALLESLNLTSPPLERDLKGYVKFVKLFKEYEIGDLIKEESKEGEVIEIEEGEIVEEKEVGGEYFDKFLTKNELAYHKQLELRIDLEDPRRISNFTGRIIEMHIFVGNFIYIADFMIVEHISLLIDPCLSQVVLGEPFFETSNMTYDSSLGIVKFTNGVDEIVYKMPHKIEQFQSLSNMEKEHKQSVYFRNEEDIKRGVGYVMEKIFGFYKEFLELGPEYETNKDKDSSVNDVGVT